MSQLDGYFQFKIGDIVTLKGSLAELVHPNNDGAWGGIADDTRTFEPVRLQILTRFLEECPGGIQKHYYCREMAASKKGIRINPDLLKVNEIEVAELPPQTPKKKGALTELEEKIAATKENQKKV